MYSYTNVICGTVRKTDKLDALMEQQHQEIRKIEENMQTVTRFERIAREYESHILEYTGKREEIELQIAVLEKSRKLILKHTSKGNELESQIAVIEKMVQSLRSQLESIHGLLQEASRKYNKAFRSCEKEKQRIKHSEKILDRLDVEVCEAWTELGVRTYCDYPRKSKEEIEEEFEVLHRILAEQ